MHIYIYIYIYIYMHITNERQVTPMIDKGAVSLGNGWARRSFKATIDAVLGKH